MDKYTLQPSTLTKREMCLVIDLLDPTGVETRGAALAKACGGRYAREGRCFYFTAAKARQWELLFSTGFSARAGTWRGAYGWRFHHPAVKWPMRKGDAMVSARIAANRPHAVQVPQEAAS